MSRHGSEQIPTVIVNELETEKTGTTEVVQAPHSAVAEYPPDSGKLGCQIGLSTSFRSAPSSSYEGYCGHNDDEAWIKKAIHN